jgi:hypothetical protein
MERKRHTWIAAFLASSLALPVLFRLVEATGVAVAVVSSRSDMLVVMLYEILNNKSTHLSFGSEIQLLLPEIERSPSSSCFVFSGVTISETRYRLDTRILTSPCNLSLDQGSSKRLPRHPSPAMPLPRPRLPPHPPAAVAPREMFKA